jgi:hypothetical protein
VRVVLVLLAGCWTNVPPPTSPPVPGPGPSESRPYAESFRHQRPASSGPRNSIPRRSVWTGTYICTQGLTAVTLTLELSASGELEGLYEFGPVPSNPTVPEGSFELTGHLMANGRQSFTGELEPGEWIRRPPTYTAIAMTIEANGRDMVGVIKSPNCRDFKLTRIE